MKRVFLAVLLSLFVCGVVNAADVTGKWEGSFDYTTDYEKYNYDFTMKLTQKGRNIKGTLDFNECGKKCTVKGKINGLKVILFIKKSRDSFCERNLRIRAEGELSENKYMSFNLSGKLAETNDWYNISGEGEAEKIK